jgi:hypothetical protein
MTGTDGRLVPVDDRIPSIVENTLRRFESNFGLYDAAIQAALLDHWPPSKTLRKLKLPNPQSHVLYIPTVIRMSIEIKPQNPQAASHFEFVNRVT